MIRLLSARLSGSFANLDEFGSNARGLCATLQDSRMAYDAVAMPA
jgi:hypothetical protein